MGKLSSRWKGTTGSPFPSSLSLHLRPDELDDDGKHGHDDDAVDDDAEIVLHDRDVAEEIPGGHQTGHPENRPGDVEGQELDRRHERIPGVDPEMWQPAQTDALLYLMYALFGIAIAATVIAAVFQFGAALKDNPASAIKSLLGLVLLVVVLIIAWAMGSGTPMNIPGYEGTDNVYFWLKLTDMFLYSIYILLFVTVVAIIVSGIKKKLS